MGLISEGNLKAQRTLTFWESSLAWKNMGDWAKGLTWEKFSNKLRTACLDGGLVGLRADALLDDAIHEIERRPRDVPGVILSFKRSTKTQDLGQQATA